jgi:hypothetical protein
VHSAAAVLNGAANARVRDDALVSHMLAALEEARAARAGPAGAGGAQTVANVWHAAAVLNLAVAGAGAGAGLRAWLLAALVEFPSAEGFAPQGVANVAWAAAVLDVRERAVAEWLLTALEGLLGGHPEGRGGRRVADRALRQARQYLLWAQLEPPPGADGAARLRALSVEVDRRLAGRAAPPARSSQLQREVAASARALFGDAAVSEEWLCPQSLYSVDVRVAVPPGGAAGAAGAALAIEVDGPRHFALVPRAAGAGGAEGARTVDALETGAEGFGRVRLGSGALKHRLLAALGQPLLVVPFWEWPREESSQHKYLARRAHEVLTAPGARQRGPGGGPGV